MELRRLEHFVALAETRSFTRAARSLYMAQSALSASIKALERELGAALFVRTTHQVELTDVGAVLLPEALATLASARAAKDAVDAVAGGLRGVLRLGIMQAHSLIGLADIVADFHFSRPGVDIRLQPAQGGSASLVRDVISGELDLAFAASLGTPTPGVRSTHLMSVPILLTLPARHFLAGRQTVRIGELGGERFVETPEGWGTRFLTDNAFVRAGVAREVTIEVADHTTLVDLVRTGLALGFSPPLSRREAAGEAAGYGADSGVVQVRTEPELLLDVALVMPTARRLSPTARAFAATVMRKVEARLNPAPDAQPRRREPQAASRPPPESGGDGAAAG